MVARRNEKGALLEAGRLLREVGRLHVRAQREPVARCGLTPATCHIVTELDRAGPLGVTDLARRLDLHKGWVSRGVAALAREGLLDRVPDPEDARAFAVGLSSAGRRRVAALHRALDAQAARVLARAGGDLAALGRALATVRDALRDELAGVDPAAPRRRRA